MPPTPPPAPQQATKPPDETTRATASTCASWPPALQQATKPSDETTQAHLSVHKRNHLCTLDLPTVTEGGHAQDLSSELTQTVAESHLRTLAAATRANMPM